MNWMQYVKQLETPNEDTGFGFNAPLPASTLVDIKKAFHLNELPAQLESLLLQTDGIQQKFRDVVTGYLIWPSERIVETNLEYRNYPDFKDLYMSFDQLFFFSDAGNGDLFAFVSLNGNFTRNDVFVWNHEDDSRTWVAPNLEKFLDWWLNGQITV